MRSRGSRVLSAVVGVVLMITVAGCGSEDRPAVEVTDRSDGAEDQVVQVVRDYWDERIRVESSGEYADADFEGILDASLLETKIATYASYDEFSFRREGEPVLRDVEAKVDGTRAVVTVCLNEGPWKAVADAQTVEQPKDEFVGIAYSLERRESNWIMIDEGGAPPEEQSC